MMREPEAQGAQVDVEQGAVQVLEGSTFMISDARGDVREGGVAGLFHEDTRHLNRWVLTVNGALPVVLTSRSVDYYSAVFFLTNAALDGIPEKALTIERHRFVGDGLRERIRIHNHLLEPVELEVRLSCGTDFADLFEVKGKEIRKAGDAFTDHDHRGGILRFTYMHDEFRVGTIVRPAHVASLERTDMIWTPTIEPRGSWHTGVDVVVHIDEELQELRHDSFGDPQRTQSAEYRRWRREVPQVAEGNDVVWHVMERSVTDLAALRLRAHAEGNMFALPAAGLPWFMAIFGRDTLITSYQSMWVGPDLARGALTALASWQGTEVNDFKDEEPGKILHEVRFGELASLGEKPHRPYYGSADSTPLWLILLSELWRWTGDDETVHGLRDNAMRALGWIDHHGDLDGDGFIEYRTRSPQGLRTQGWKDSWNGIQFSDGTLPEPPIALCEVQGYAYDAKVRAAELAERVWGEPDLAERLRTEAAALRDRFNDAFWIDRRGGYYALGLDERKRPIDSMTSNMGHLLWSGIVPPERAPTVRDALFSEPMWSGWGVRTMSAEDQGYNPIGYHIGSVWPHDNSLVAAGLARYGLREEANRIVVAMLDAAGHVDHRLPEVLAGYSRQDAPFPVRYPTASSPQAWATAAPFLWLRLALGLDVKDGELVAEPVVPPELGKVRIQGVHARGEHWEVWGEGDRGDAERMEGARHP